MKTCFWVQDIHMIQPLLPNTQQRITRASKAPVAGGAGGGGAAAWLARLLMFVDVPKEFYSLECFWYGFF